MELLTYKALQIQAALRRQKNDCDLQIQKLLAILKSKSFIDLAPNLQDDLLWSLNDLRRRSGVLTRRIDKLYS